MKVKSESEVAQSCPTPSDPMDFSLPGPSVHGISQARVLEWGAIAFSVVTPSQHQRLILNQFVQLVLCPRMTVVLSLASGGENILSSDPLYGGTHKLFHELLPRFGVETRTVNGNDPATVAAACDAKTRLLFVETPANPTLRVVDLRLCAAEAKRHGIPLVVDN